MCEIVESKEFFFISLTHHCTNTFSACSPVIDRPFVLSPSPSRFPLPSPTSHFPFPTSHFPLPTRLFHTGVVVYAVIFLPSSDVAVHDAPVAPVVIQFLVYVFVLAPFVLPSPIPLWPYRAQCFKLFADSFATMFGAPFCFRMPVTIRHVLLADSLTSATLLVWDLCYSVCHFSTTSWSSTAVRGSDGVLDKVDVCNTGAATYVRVAIYVMPFAIRFAQCVALLCASRAVRHALNAGKYLSAIAVVFTSAAQSWVSPASATAMRGVWIASMIIKTLYCYAWDVRMDWGLGHKRLLRHTICFEPWYYYAAMLTNLLGRVSWALAISPNFCGESCSLSLSIIEIIRRAQWLVYRVGEYKGQRGRLWVLDVKRAYRCEHIYIYIRNHRYSRIYIFLPTHYIHPLTPSLLPIFPYASAEFEYVLQHAASLEYDHTRQMAPSMLTSSSGLQDDMAVADDATQVEFHPNTHDEQLDFSPETSASSLSAQEAEGEEENGVEMKLLPIEEEQQEEEQGVMTR